MLGADDRADDHPNEGAAGYGERIDQLAQVLIALAGRPQAGFKHGVAPVQRPTT